MKHSSKKKIKKQYYKKKIKKSWALENNISKKYIPLQRFNKQLIVLQI